jgi:hypothetical protein
MRRGVSVLDEPSNCAIQQFLETATLEKKLIPFHTNLEGHSPQREGNQPLKHRE